MTTSRKILGLALALSVPFAAHAATLLIDFGAASTGYPTLTTGWNNITSSIPANTPTALMNSTGSASGISLSYSGFHAGGASGNLDGTQTPSGDAGAYPATATRDSIFGSVALFNGESLPSITVTISGLSGSELYKFTYFGSRAGVADIRTANYSVTNGSATSVSVLNASNNTSNTISSTFLAPSPTGTLTLTITPDATNTNPSKFFYLGVLEINSVAAVPEPGAYAALVGCAVLGLVAVRRGRRA